MRISLALLATTSLFFGACGENQSVENSQSKAYVTKTQADAAFKIVQAIDYIPFSYIVDGCYARSLYMSMELAANRIPSTAYYMFGTLQPTYEVAWGYHVAPLIKVLGSNEIFVLDPAFQTKPLKLAEWEEKNNPQGSVETLLKAGSAYFDPTGRTPEYTASTLIKNFQEMPTFLTSDIASACTVMYSYIDGQKDKTDGVKIEQRKKLLSRTSVLLNALESNGKLEDDGVNSDASRVCRKAVGY